MDSYYMKFTTDHYKKSLLQKIQTFYIGTTIFFICPSVRESFEQIFSISEFGMWTITQHKNVNEHFSFII